MRSNSNDSNISEKIISSAQYANEENYWLNQLAGPSEKSKFPYDFKRTGENKTRQAYIDFAIPGEVCVNIIKISKGSAPKIYMVLTAGLLALLDKYTYERNKEIIIGAPIYKQEVQKDFINTVLALKTPVDEQLSFKEFLRQVRQTIIDANENANYPIETLLYQLDLPTAADEFPLFDVAILLKNIHDRDYLNEIHLNMIFSFIQTGENIQGTVEYNALLYEKNTIERIIRHYNQLLTCVLNRPDSLMGRVEILSEEEKQQVLLVFNQTGFKFPEDQTVDRLFAKQAEAIPDNTAVVYEDKHLTYEGLNEKADSLARVLRCKGVNRDIIVGIMVTRSLEMITGMLAVLKAGGAYLPIDPDYPEARKKFMLEDSQAQLIMTQKVLLQQYKYNNIPESISGENIIDLQDEKNYSNRNYNMSYKNKPDDLIYVIYTSGTTGQPKGVLIGHKGFVNLVYVHQTVFGEHPGSRVSQVASISFDAMAFEVWPCLTNGASLYLAANDIRMDPAKMKEWLINREIIISFQSTMMFERLLREEWPGTGVALRVLRTAGDKLNRCPVRKYPFRLYNLYGPTEDTVWTTWTEVAFETDEGKDPTIGKPVGNHQVCIVDTSMSLQPIGIPGELCITGIGLARGYLNQPQLTAKKFPHNLWFFPHYQGKNQKFLQKMAGPGGGTTRFLKKRPPGRRRQKIYKTGDLARWLADGNIEFLGRIDSQVKIRGYRIELGEVERQLIDHPGIKEAVVIARKMSIRSAGDHSEGDLILCAYIVSNRELPGAELREYLSEELPDYMIPSHFVQMETIPLTPAGKIDRKALPEPKVSIGENYVAPRNEIEKELALIWSELLGIPMEKISIHDNFFHLGGHSLKATLLAAKIHEKLDVSVPLAEIFRIPLLKNLAAYIKKETLQNKYTSIEPVEAREYYDLSSAQKRLYVIQQMDQGSTVYNMPVVMTMIGELHRVKFEEIFKKLIQRHETLRTSFHMLNEKPVQKVHDNVNFEIEYPDFQSNPEFPMVSIDDRVKNFVRPFDLAEAPLLRVNLIKEGSQKHTLMIDMNHIISDGTSMGIFVNEFMTLKAGKNPGLLQTRYRDWAQWQNHEKNSEKVKIQEAFWLTELEGKIPVLHLPCDYTRPAVQDFSGKRVTFALTPRETEYLKKLALQEEVTLYMFLLSVYYVLLYKLTGQEDIVIGAPTAGRGQVELQKIIGMFLNTLALRNLPGGGKSFKIFLKEVKAKVLKAFENQEYQFDDLVDRLGVNRGGGRNPLFDVMFILQNQGRPEIKIPGLELITVELEHTTTKFDFSLYAEEVGHDLLFSVTFREKLFTQTTITIIIDYFKTILASLIKNPDLELWNINVISEERRTTILSQLNTDLEGEAKNMMADGIFQTRLNKSFDKFKDNIAIEYTCHSMSYAELDRGSNRICRWISDNGIDRETFVGILTDNKLDVIVTMIGIIKAGCVVVPLYPGYPIERLIDMIQVTRLDYLFIDKSNTPRFKESPHLSPGKIKLIYPQELLSKGDSAKETKEIKKAPVHYTPDDPLYIHFTSGTTGKPRAIIGRNKGLLHFISWEIETFGISSHFRAAQFTIPGFDPFLRDVFAPMLAGGVVCIPGEEEIVTRPTHLAEWIDMRRISLIHCVTGLFRLLISSAPPPTYFKNLKYILLAGEKTNPSDLVEWYEIFGERVQLVNGYGPTETTMSKAYYLISPRDILRERIPIGKPLKGSRIVIFDGNGNLCGPLLPGEICIRTPYRSLGYYDAGELHQEKIISNPYSEDPGDNIYRSGDLGRILADGNIDILGRIDRQVKIRGYRVELEEVEGQLAKHPLVKEAVVMKKGNSSETEFLCAYITITARGAGTPGDQEALIVNLKESLTRKLPDYMVPANILIMGMIPRKATGKVDFDRLPDPIERRKTGYVPPGNQIEEKLVILWSEILKIEKIGINDSFFELGGNSLNVVSLKSKIHSELDIKIPLGRLFSIQTVSKQARLIMKAGKDKMASMEPVEEKEYYTLSPAQKRLYVLQQIDPTGISYNISRRALLEGELEKTRLVKAFKELIRRHESLRTSFLTIEDEPVQKINSKVEFEIEYYDLQVTGASDRSRWEQEEVSRHSFVRPFVLSRPPLVRTGLIKIGEKKHILMLDMHHIITDGTSETILYQNFMELYHKKELPPLRLRYKDFSHWQNHRRQKLELKNQEEFWLKQFPGEIPKLNLPIDFPRPSIKSFAGKTFTFNLDEKRTAALKQMASANEATLYMVLISITYILLSKLSGQEEIVIGTPIAGRTHPAGQQIIGMFVNTLALINNPHGEKTYTGFLGEVKRRTLEYFENQDYPFEHLVEKLSPNLNLDMDLGRNPLFDVMFVLQNMERAFLEIPGLRLTPGDFERTTARFDLILMALEEDRGLKFRVEYSTALYKEQTLERYTQYFKRIVSAVISGPGKRLWELEMLPGKEKKQVLFEFNNTEVVFPGEKTIHELFEDQVEQTPGNIAAAAQGPEREKSGGERFAANMRCFITYRELNKRANGLARTLKAKGVKPDGIVGIMLNRSIGLMVGLFAILKAGAGYLPMDPGYPGQRMKFMREDSGARLILSRAGHRAAIFNENEVEILDIDDESINGSESNNPVKVDRLNQAAYTIYTSGSTGRPRGVIVEHRSVVNRLNWMQKAYPINEQDIILQKTPIVFDVSVWELFWWSFQGASVCMLGPGKEKMAEAIIEAVQEDKVTVMHFVPSMLNVLLEYLDICTETLKIFSIRRVFSSGEALNATQVERFYRLMKSKGSGRVKLINLYGPTEATVDVSYYDCVPGENPHYPIIPIGKPIDNTCLYIIGRYMQIQPPGVVGELYIGGVGLARGYLNQPELTNGKFERTVISHSSFVIREKEKDVIGSSSKTNDRSHSPPSPIYRSGDLARWLGDGNIEFLGRRDFQVKIRGNRIELGEIQRRLTDRIEIKEAVVVDRKDETGHRYLAAYLVPAKSFKAGEIREYLARELPEYMIPSYFVILEKIPLTPNGKLDRRALPGPRAETGNRYIPPRGQTQRKLAEIWQTQLNVARVGINDNYFQIGGDSIKAIKTINIINRTFAVQMRMEDLFRHPTLERLENRIEARKRENSGESLKEALKEIEAFKNRILKKNKLPFEPGNIEDVYPMSDIEKGMIYYTLKAPESGIYHDQFIYQLHYPDFNLENFEKAFKLMMEKHSILRTGFILEAFEEPVQLVYKKAGADIRHHDISSMDKGRQEKFIKETMIKDRKEPFNLARPPLCRMIIFRIGHEEICALWVFHHAILDGWSTAALMTELNNTYVKLKTEPDFVPIRLRSSYKDFIIEQVAEKKKKAVIDYWKQELDGYKRLDFSGLRGSDGGTGKKTCQHDFRISLPDQLREVSKKYKTSVKHICFGIYLYMLYMISYDSDITVGLVTHTRPLIEDGDKILGCFLNTIPVRIKIPGKIKWSDYLRLIDKKMVELKRYERLSFFEILKSTGETPHGGNPIFDTMFNFVNFYIYEQVAVDNAAANVENDIKERLSIEEYQNTNTLLDFSINTTGQVFSLTITYSNALLKDEALKNLLLYFQDILKEILQNPEQFLSKDRIIPRAEKRKLLVKFNSTKSEYPPGKTINELFARQLEKTPYHTALVGKEEGKKEEEPPGRISNAIGGGHLTYKELNEKSHRLAHLLREKGVKAETIVGVMLERSLEMIISILGILKAGGIYLPIDTKYPAGRIEYILADSNTKYLISEPVFHRQKLSIDTSQTIILKKEFSKSPPGCDWLKDNTTPKQGAYIIYTSGSTGKPRGVIVNHNSVVNILLTLQRLYPLTSTGTYLLKTSFMFDVSVSELFGWFIEGGRLAVLELGGEKNPGVILNIIRRERVTHVNFVPSMFRVFVEMLDNQNIRKLAGLKYIFLAGEELSPGLVQKFRSFNTAIELENLYGPTEATVYASGFSLSQWNEPDPVSIGKPLANVQIYILDEFMQILPLGVPGELFIGGEGVGMGYLNNPQLTADKFGYDLWDLWDLWDDQDKKREVEKIRSLEVKKKKKNYTHHSPLTTPHYTTLPLHHSPIYRTGDLARWLPDGNIEFLGRMDHQVKIRGFRIEPGEIENQLLAHELVEEVIVMDREGPGREKDLCAFLVSPPIGINMEEAQISSRLKKYLSHTLPAYMIPAYFIVLEQFPLTPNGKIDRKALLTRKISRSGISSTYAAPVTRLERVITGIWKEVLQLDQVGIHDNFFETGGNSLNILTVHSRLKQRLSMEIPMVKLFKYPTVQSLAVFLAGDEGEKEIPAAETVPAKQTGTGGEMAVIGMSGIFPGAENIHEFWENLKHGRETITFFTGDELKELGVEPGLIEDPNFVKAGGIIKNAEYFDAVFFNYTPREAQLIDPQVRLFHQCVWHALEDAGYHPFLYKRRIGLYAGATANIYFQALSVLTGPKKNQYQANLLGNKDFMCTHISYKLDLKGPSFTIQTACSTSLAAIHLAVKGLKEEECEMALAGGITVTSPFKAGYIYQEGMILSPDGHCRAFDTHARGIVGGNGAGVVLLKPLDRARAERDHIYAVIKGTAINNDGSRKVGYTAPGIQGQTAVIRAAHAAARVDPKTITYIEAHGTGTQLGDPIEVEALKTVFNTPGTNKKYCGIGSVKPNIGHLDSAAGVAGFIKTALALYHGRIPPTLHFQTPNPKLGLEDSPFYVVSELTRWKTRATPRRASVSSMGIGGTNAHVILEDAPKNCKSVNPWISESVRKEIGSRENQLILVSAKTEAALNQMNENLAEYLKVHPGINLADVAYTLQVGRGTYPYRQMIVGTEVKEVFEVLTNRKKGKMETFSPGDTVPYVVFMFPGQGSQYVNMGLDLYRDEPVFRREMDRCIEILEPIMECNIKEILYPSSTVPHGIPGKRTKDIIQTGIAQPLIFSIQYALARLLIQWGITPNAMLGHSIGEYTAAHLAGVFSLDHVLKLVALRGRLMQRMPPGAMLSVPLSEEELKTLINENISIAAVNSSSRCVVSGTHEAIDALKNQLKEKGYETRRLHTSHAFHSPMMESILKEFEEAVEQVRKEKPQIPYISNVSGQWIMEEEALNPAYWAAHIRKTVRFAQGISEILKKESTNAFFVEIGPGNALSTFIKQHQEFDKKQAHRIIDLIRPPREYVSDDRYLSNQIGILWLYGKNPDWYEFHKPQKRYRIPLPPYPFDRTRYWPEGDFSRIGSDRISLNNIPPKKPDTADWFYIPTWERSILNDPVQPDRRSSTGWLVFMDECGIGARLVKLLEQESCSVIAVKAGTGFKRMKGRGYALKPTEKSNYRLLFEELKKMEKIPTRIVHLWGITGNHETGIDLENTRRLQDIGFFSLLNIVQAIEDEGIREKIHIGVVTDNMQEVTGEEVLCPAKATILGAIKVIPQEYPDIECTSIDIFVPAPDSPLKDKQIEMLAKELKSGFPRNIVVLRGNHRWIQTMKPYRLEKLPRSAQRLRNQGVYLITGGLGGIGFTLAAHLAMNWKARLILVSRSPFPLRKEWKKWLSTHDEEDNISIKIRKVKEWEKNGAKIVIESADTTDLRQMKKVIARAQKRFDPINGIIHAAGAADYEGIIQKRTREMTEKVMAPKVTGTLVLDTILKRVEPDFFLLFSSLGNVLYRVGFGQVGYNAANEFLEAYATYKTSRDGILTTAINWNSWLEVGMAKEATHRKAGQRGKNPKSGPHLPGALKTREGVEVFDRIMGYNLDRVTVSPHDLEILLQQMHRQVPGEPGTDIQEGKGQEPPGPSITMHQRPEMTAQYTGPGNVTEHTLVKIWQRFLRVEPIGIHDNFFQLGGDSLLAIQLISVLNKRFNAKLSSHILLKAPTIAEVIRLLERDRVFSPSRLVEIQAGINRKPLLFLIHPIGGNIYFYRDLAETMPDQAIYGIKAQGVDGEAEPITRIEEMAALYIKELQYIQPEGPYYLGGASFGGMVAFEMARQLYARQSEAALLFMVDTPGPGHMPDEFKDDADIMAYLLLTMDRNTPVTPGQIRQMAPARLREFLLEYGGREAKKEPDAFIADVYLQLRIFRSHLKAMFAYVPKIYPGTILYFRAVESMPINARDPEKAWINLAAKGLEIHDVPGDHINMIFHPHVRVIADVLKNAINTRSRRKNGVR